MRCVAKKVSSCGTWLKAYRRSVRQLFAHAIPVRDVNDLNVLEGVQQISCAARIVSVPPQLIDELALLPQKLLASLHMPFSFFQMLKDAFPRFGIHGNNRVPQ